jgi:hypothetical protein
MHNARQSVEFKTRKVSSDYPSKRLKALWYLLVKETGSLAFYEEVLTLETAD